LNIIIFHERTSYSLFVSLNRRALKGQVDLVQALFKY